MLRLWALFPKAHGYLYQIVERYGSRLADDPLECRLFNGAKVTCDLHDHIQRLIYFYGSYEPIETYIVRALLHPGMVVVDAGANIGQYTLLAAMEVGIHGQVHAFEPVPKNFKQLAAHVLKNNLTNIVHMSMIPLWYKPETLSLCLRADMADNAGAYSVGMPSEGGDVLSWVNCLATTLDDYVAEKSLKKVDFIKMDIEGSEWFALRGAVSLFSYCQPTILLEINRETCRMVGYEPEKLWEFLKPYGYHMWLVGNAPWTCRPLLSLGGVDRANVIFHIEPLPEMVTKGWSLKGILQSHRYNAGIF